MTLQLEYRPQEDQSAEIDLGPECVAVVTPPIDEDYWLLRVKLSDKQAIVGFPKFFTIGVGFAQEEDWNTNLPYRCLPDRIFEHIKHNKGDDSIDDADCLKAIQMVCEAAHKMLCR